MFLEAEEKRGLWEEKWGLSGVKAALQIPLHRMQKKRLTLNKRSSTKTPSAGCRESPTKFIHEPGKPR